MADTAMNMGLETARDRAAAAVRKLGRRKPIRTTPREAFFFEKSRLMVIAINNNGQLVYKAQTGPNGPFEADWTPIASQGSYQVMAAGLARDGRVAVAAHADSNPDVQYFIESQASSGGVESWDPPISLGHPASVSKFSQLVFTRNRAGLTNIFGVAEQTGEVWWIYQNHDRLVTKQVTITPPGTKTPITIEVQELAPPEKPWSGWQQLGSMKFSGLSNANDADGRIALAGTAPNSGQYPNTVWFSQQKTADGGSPSDWSPWTQIDQGTGGVVGVAMRADRQGILNIFGITSADVAQRRQLGAAGDTFGPWIRPGMTGKVILTLTCGLSADDTIVVVAQDESGRLYCNEMIDSGYQIWRGWQQIAVAPGIGPLSLDFNADGRLTLFLQQGLSPQTLSCISQSIGNSTAWEANWTTLSTAGLSKYAVVRDLTPPASAL
jgi:hypothetical protein